jgi:hypothetical protein
MSKSSGTNYSNAYKTKLYQYISFLGDYSSEVHLFPFRTEKLSSLAQMVLQ